MSGWLSNLVRREIRAIRRVLRADADPSIRPMPLEDLKPDPSNVIARSLEGYGQSLRVLTLKGTVIAGHHTLMAARELGWKTVKARDIDTGAEYEIEL